MEVPDSRKSGLDIMGLLVSIRVINVARGDIAGAERILEMFEGYGRSSDVQGGRGVRVRERIRAPSPRQVSERRSR